MGRMSIVEKMADESLLGTKNKAYRTMSAIK